MSRTASLGAATEEEGAHMRVGSTAPDVSCACAAGRELDGEDQDEGSWVVNEEEGEG